MVNTKVTSGVKRRLEKSFGHRFQWPICMLHTNELSLRHVLTHQDGLALNTGLRGYSELIRKKVLRVDHFTEMFEPILLQVLCEQ